jgi:hypothetical protein
VVAQDPGIIYTAVCVRGIIGPVCGYIININTFAVCISSVHVVADEYYKARLQNEIALFLPPPPLLYNYNLKPVGNIQIPDTSC